MVHWSNFSFRYKKIFSKYFTYSLENTFHNENPGDRDCNSTDVIARSFGWRGGQLFSSSQIFQIWKFYHSSFTQIFPHVCHCTQLSRWPTHLWPKSFTASCNQFDEAAKTKKTKKTWAQILRERHQRYSYLNRHNIIKARNQWK